MDRSERIGLGLAIAGHVVLFGLLSVGFLATPNPVPLQPQPIDVSLVDEVGLEATAPQAVTPPSQAEAPEQGPPEDAPAPAPGDVAPEPDPAPPKPQPEAAPPPKPAPVAKPQPPKKPAPPAPIKPAPSPPQRVAAAPAKVPPAAKPATGTSATATKPRPRGSRLGDDFLKGLSDKPSKTVSDVPMAAKIDARALASIVQAIARQIQPCADRQVNPGPGANAIVITLNLRLNQDGSLAGTPRVVGSTGDDGENSRYVQRVTDLGIAAFKGCSPLKLPAEFYHTPNGGWDNINYKWQLR